VLALCFTSNKHLLQLYQTVTNLIFEVPVRSILCIPQKSPPHTIEHVICVFEIGVDLVLVFVGFGLFQICSHLPFSPHSKDHALHRNLSQPIPVFNVDGSLNEAGSITKVTNMIMTYKGHSERILLTVTQPGKQDTILGMTWLKKHNLEIDFTTGSVKLTH